MLIVALYEQVADAPPGHLSGSHGGIERQVPRLGEDVFERVHVPAAGQIERLLGAELPDHPPRGPALVVGGIDNLQNVLRGRRRNRGTFNLNTKGVAAGRSIQDQGMFQGIG